MSLKEQLKQVQEQIKRLDASNLGYFQKFRQLEPLLCKEAHLKKLLGMNV